MLLEHWRVLTGAISWTGPSQLSMRSVTTMKKVKGRRTDTAQTGEAAKDPQVQDGLLVLTAEVGREVAQTMGEARRGAAQTTAGEAAALIMAGEAAQPAVAAAAEVITPGEEDDDAALTIMTASAEKLVLAMTGPPAAHLELGGTRETRKAPHACVVEFKHQSLPRQMKLELVMLASRKLVYLCALARADFAS